MAGDAGAGGDDVPGAAGDVDEVVVSAAERRTRHTEEVTYTIEITKPNLPKWDTVPET